MAIITEEVELAGSQGREKVEALFDSDASYSCIKRELGERLDILIALPEPIELGTAKSGEIIRVTEAVRLNFHLNGCRFSDEFMVIPELSEAVIIGSATMQKWRFKLDFENDRVIIDPKVTKLRLL